jgi:hypothetical protein
MHYNPLSLRPPTCRGPLGATYMRTSLSSCHLQLSSLSPEGAGGKEEKSAGRWTSFGSSGPLTCFRKRIPFSRYKSGFVSQRSDSQLTFLATTNNSKHISQNTTTYVLLVKGRYNNAFTWLRKIRQTRVPQLLQSRIHQTQDRKQSTPRAQSHSPAPRWIG